MARPNGCGRREAERLRFDHYQGLVDKTNGYALRLLFALAFNYHQSGHLELARQTAQEMLHHATRRKLAVIEGWAHNYLGVVAYEWNNLDEAERHFRDIVDRRYAVHASAARNGLIGLALVHQARGESDQA